MRSPKLKKHFRRTITALPAPKGVIAHPPSYHGRSEPPISRANRRQAPEHRPTPQLALFPDVKPIDSRKKRTGNWLCLVKSIAWQAANKQT
jgi:hypothetical protein